MEAGIYSEEWSKRDEDGIIFGGGGESGLATSIVVPFQKKKKLPFQSATMTHCHCHFFFPFFFSILSFGVLVLASCSPPPPPPRCKAVPGTSSWPSLESWAKLNASLHGRLVKPSPPGAVCHPSQPTFDRLACPAVQAGWLTTYFHAEDPVSSMENNWNNDTCLPVPTDPCSGEGYPVYVVNATCK